ncbi:MAG: glycosyltransferase family 39 protein [Microgenomates group bacterium]
MGIIKRILNSPITWVVGISVIYVLSRLTNLTALPIFTDEAIYLRWSQIGGNDASWRFISLTDGKQPLFTWFVMAAMRCIKDPLFAGRMVSVVAGFVSIWGMYALGSELFKNKRIGVIASLLYLISPFTLMYDRMALYDALVATFFIWNGFFTVLLARRERLDVALILGLSIGVGMLNKTSANFSLYLLPLSLLLFNFKEKRVLKRLAKWVGLALIVAVLSQAIYSILRLSPYFYIIAQKDTTFIYTYAEWITHPFRFWRGNLHGEFDWMISYLTIPIFIASLASLIVFWKKPMEKVLLLGWWFAPFFALALFGKVLYPRYVLFMSMPMLVLAAYTFDFLLQKIRPKFLSVLFIGLLCFSAIRLSVQIVTDIQYAPIPKSDIGQYINDWPSGWGTNEIVTILETQAKDKPIAVYTEGTFGLYPFALEIYLWQNKNIKISGIWPPPETIPPDVQKSAEEKDTYYVVYQKQDPNAYKWPMTLIAKYQKGNSENVYTFLYKIELPKKP